MSTTCEQHFKKNGVCNDCGIGRVSFLANGCQKGSPPGEGSKPCPKVLIVCSDEGDWEGLYIDGKLAKEGHNLSVFDVLKALDISFESFSVSLTTDLLPAKACDLPEPCE